MKSCDSFKILVLFMLYFIPPLASMEKRQAVNANGVCTTTSDCIENSVCVNFGSLENGLCFCLYGYRSKNGQCMKLSEVVGSQQESANKPSMLQTVTSGTATATTISSVTPAGFLGEPSVDDQGNATEAVCVQLLHATKFSDARCFNGGTCHDVNTSLSYCICPLDWAGRRCSNKVGVEPINEEKANQAKRYLGYRYENQKYADGSTWVRHYASNLNQCLQQCQEAAPACQSVNFGNYPNQKDKLVCELLTIRADPDNQLGDWLIAADDWTYACCV